MLIAPGNRAVSAPVAGSDFTGFVVALLPLATTVTFAHFASALAAAAEAALELELEAAALAALEADVAGQVCEAVTVEPP
ncbi:MAG: hypothetical protein AAB613_01010 [Patescibacteria group bacterium]